MAAKAKTTIIPDEAMLQQIAEQVRGRLNKRRFPASQASKQKALASIVETFVHETIESTGIKHERGNAAKGVDLPSLLEYPVDIKSTWDGKPQGSGFYTDASDAIYGMSTGILMFTYDIEDDVLVWLEPVVFRPEETADKRLTDAMHRLLKTRPSRAVVELFLETMMPGLSPLELKAIATEIRKDPNRVPHGWFGLTPIQMWRFRAGQGVRHKRSELEAARVAAANGAEDAPELVEPKRVEPKPPRARPAQPARRAA
jgi:hypothetical protein